VAFAAPGFTLLFAAIVVARTRSGDGTADRALLMARADEASA
jgi:hypothetical protein